MASSVDAEVYNATVEGLGLSARSLNSLKRAHINKVGEILEQKRSELLKIRNFGSKSLEELYARLDELGFLPEEINIQDSGEDPETDTINDKDLESFEVSEEEEP